jgi:hypothetical protein
MANAYALRVDDGQLGRIIRSPWSLLAFAVCSTLAIVVWSNGCAVTRSLVETAMRPAPRIVYLYENRLFAYTAPIVFGLGTAALLVWVSRVRLRHAGWKSWTFFLVKTGWILVIVPLLWIEGGAALRANIPHFGLRMLGAGLGLAFLFIAVFASAVLWSFADQRQRCPVCLRRLSLPVTLGSWASLLEPPQTEFLCEQGHGALAVSDAGTGEPDRWIALDTSWRGL